MNQDQITHPLKIEIDTQGQNVAFVVDKFEGTEKLSTLYTYTFYAHTTQLNMDDAQFLGTEQTFTFEFKDHRRYFRGIVSEISQEKVYVTPHGIGNAHYKIVLRPKLWVQTLSQDYRIFQNQSVHQIIGALLIESGITNFSNRCRVRGFDVRTYCVQYNESRYDFMARLLEEEGITFFYVHNAQTSHLYLCDDTRINSIPLAQKEFSIVPFEKTHPEINTLLSVGITKNMTPSYFECRDYNDEKPSVTLSSTYENARKHTASVYEYPGHFKDNVHAQHKTMIRAEEKLCNQEILQGKSTILDFSPGHIFELTQHSRLDFNQSYVLTHVHHEIDVHVENEVQTRRYSNTFHAIPQHISFTPPRQTPKPRMHSIETGCVVGPPGEEIFVDDMGRIKVQFHWNIHGITEASTSCWMRVSQNWSGAGYGSMIVPRIGMEVLISYINGDPDHPMVMGCVYNGDNMPPSDFSSTRSIFKSRSSLGGAGANEIYVEDQSGQEEIYLHAQGELNTRIQKNRHTCIHQGDDLFVLDKGHQQTQLRGENTSHSTILTQGTHTLSIQMGDQVIHLMKGDQNTKIEQGSIHSIIEEGSHQTSIHKGDLCIQLGDGHIKIQIQGDLDISTSGDIRMSALGNIDLCAGGKMNLTSKQGLTQFSKGDIKHETFSSLKSMAMMNIEQKAKLNFEASGEIMGIYKGGVMAQLQGGTLALLKGGKTIAA